VSLLALLRPPSETLNPNLAAAGASSFPVFYQSQCCSMLLRLPSRYDEFVPRSIRSCGSDAFDGPSVVAATRARRRRRSKAAGSWIEMIVTRICRYDTIRKP
jgi:hypothetical protein